MANVKKFLQKWIVNNLGFKIIEIDDGYYKMKGEIDDQE